MTKRAKSCNKETAKPSGIAEGYRFDGQDEVVVHREGDRVILEPKKKAWSQEFLDLAGAAEDFPYTS